MVAFGRPPTVATGGGRRLASDNALLVAERVTLFAPAQSGYNTFVPDMSQLARPKYGTGYKITYPDTGGRVPDGLATANVFTNCDGLWQVRSDGADTVVAAADLSPGFLVARDRCALAAAAFLCRNTAEYILEVVYDASGLVECVCRNKQNNMQQLIIITK